MRWILLVSWVGCTIPSSADVGPPPADLVLCGSSTMGRRLGPRLVAAWLNAPAPSPFVRHAVRSGYRITGTPDDGSPLEVEVRYTGSREGLDALAESCHVAMDSGSVDGGAIADKAALVGQDAIMIAAHPDFPQAHATVAELRAWFSGAAPPPDGSTVFVRDADTSGTSDSLGRLLELPEQPEEARRVSESGFHTVTRGGGRWLTYTSAQETLHNSPSYQILRVSPSADAPAVGPDMSTVARRGAYPLIRPLRLVRSATSPTTAADFIDWVQRADRAETIFERLHMWHVNTGDDKTLALDSRCLGSAPGLGSEVAGQHVLAVEHEVGAPSFPAYLERHLPFHVESAMVRDRDLVVVGYASDDGPDQLERNCDLARRRAATVIEAFTATLDTLGVPPADRPTLTLGVGGPTQRWGRSEENVVSMVLAVPR